MSVAAGINPERREVIITIPAEGDIPGIVEERVTLTDEQIEALYLAVLTDRVSDDRRNV